METRIPTSGERPEKHRRASRIIVRCHDEEGMARVLLFRDTDPGVPGSQWWVTPGGGIDPGEDAPAAAVRELLEETGLRITRDQLRGPVATRLAVHGYSDQVLIQQETFYLVDVGQFEVSTEGFTEAEKVTLLAHGWFTREELDGMTVWPAQLGDYLDWDGGDCVDWGTVEESTVPVDVGQGSGPEPR